MELAAVKRRFLSGFFGPTLGFFALALAAVAAWWFWRESRDAALFRRLPAENLLLAHLDVQSLRRASALAPLLRSRVEPDPDYAGFVKQTGFDYQRDLDEAAVCYLPDRVYILARGRFNAAGLRQYALAQDGSCAGRALERPCVMPSSRPDRKISFLLLSPRLLAIATAPEADAVLQLGSAPAPNAEPLAEAARRQGPALLWITASPASLDRFLSRGPELSPAIALFAKALASAQRAYVAVGDQSPGLQLTLTAVCSGDQQAGELHRLLKSLNELAGSLMRLGRDGKRDEWSAVVSSAVIEQQKTVVRATWTLNRKVLESLAGP